jgi:hypothetical protein
MTHPPKLYLTKRRNGYFYPGWYENDPRVWKTTKCSTKSDAVQYLREFKATHQEVETILTLTALMQRYADPHTFRRRLPCGTVATSQNR